MKYLKTGSWIIFFFLGFIHFSQATHLRAGEITVERISCNGLTFRITITAYTNLGSPVKFSDGTLNFGDGRTIQTPTVDLYNTQKHILFRDQATISSPIRRETGMRESLI
jgi:hypothetical protein